MDSLSTLALIAPLAQGLYVGLDRGLSAKKDGKASDAEAAGRGFLAGLERALSGYLGVLEREDKKETKSETTKKQNNETELLF